MKLLLPDEKSRGLARHTMRIVNKNGLLNGLLFIYFPTILSQVIQKTFFRQKKVYLYPSTRQNWKCNPPTGPYLVIGIKHIQIGLILR